MKTKRHATLLMSVLRGDKVAVAKIVRASANVILSILPMRLADVLKSRVKWSVIRLGFLPHNAASRGLTEGLIDTRWEFMREESQTACRIADLTTSKSTVDMSVVTFNSVKWVDTFVASVIALDYPKSHITIRFVDHDSHDGTLSRLEFQATLLRDKGFAVHVQRRPNRGFGAGHNVAIKAGNAPFCLVTNIDLTFEPDTLSRLLEIASSDGPNVAAWEPLQKPYEHPKFYDPVSGATNWNSHACVLLRRSAIERVGFYDENIFLYGEDVELSYRLRREGYLLKYCPQAVVNHFSYEDGARLKPMQYTGSTFANLYIRLKYGNIADIAQIPVMGLWLLLKPDPFPGSRRAVIKNLIKLLRIMPSTLASRRKSKAHFSFRGWDYDLMREGAFVAVPPLRRDIPLVSVITRTYRGRESYLKEAILSVANQTYHNIEHVVVEDGGETMRPIVEWATTMTNRPIVYVALPKKGRAEAGNAGLSVSQGQWCLFLDDDDLLFADHVEVLANALNDEADAVAAYAFAWDIVTASCPSKDAPYREQYYITRHSQRQEFSHERLAVYNLMPIQAVLFKRQLFVERGGLPEGVDALEDWILWNKYAQGNRFILLPKLTSMYRTPAEPDRRRLRQKTLEDAYPAALAQISAYRQWSQSD